MKKLLLGVFVGLLILGITAPVWALEVTVGGDFRFRARQRSNFDLQSFNRNSDAVFLFWDDRPISAVSYNRSAYLDNGSQTLRTASVNHALERSRPHANAGNDDRNYIYDRIRVSVDAKIVEGLRAYVQFENYSAWGVNSQAVDPRFQGGDGGTSIYGDRASVNIRFAWVDFVIPKTPVHVKIGRQPLALGHGILLDTRTWGGDMAYVYAPIGPVTLGAFYGKMVEGNRGLEDDSTFVGAHADFAINPANKVSAFYRYVWNRTSRYYGQPNVPGPIGAAAPTVNRIDAYSSNQHGAGLAFDGKVSLGKIGLFYAAEADIIWGQYTNYIEPRSRKPWGDLSNNASWNVGTLANATAGAHRARFQEDLYQVAWGYGVQLGVDLKWVKFDIAHSYGSGDRTRAASGAHVTIQDGAATTRMHQWTTGRRVESFDAWGSDNMYSPWSTDIFMASGKSANFGGLGLGSLGFTRRWGYTGDFGDIIMIKPTLAVLPLDNLTIDGSYAAFWKTANTNSNGAGVGTGVDGEAGSLIMYKSNANNREEPNKTKISHFLGQELNGHVTYYPYKNLMLKGWAGIFFPGDYFQVKQRNHSIFSPQKGHDTVGLKPAWALQLDVIVTF